MGERGGKERAGWVRGGEKEIQIQGEKLGKGRINIVFHVQRI